jgi:hypothetical protein
MDKESSHPIEWWFLFVGALASSAVQTFACALVLHDRLHWLSLVLCIEEKRKWFSNLRHRVSTDRINEINQSSFVRLWEESLIMSIVNNS